MKNRGKNNEKWWTRENKTRKNDETEWKKQWNMMKKRFFLKKQGNIMKNRETTMKNDEKEWKKQWNMMKKREQTLKNDETD